jgi:hypothetical protein
VDDDIEDLFDFGLEFVELAHGVVEFVFGLGARRLAGDKTWSRLSPSRIVKKVKG